MYFSPIMQQLKDLPSPKGHFLWGHLPAFRKGQNSHLVLEQWAKIHGDLFKIHFAGQPLIVSTNPQINQEILNRRPKEFRRLQKLTNVIREMGVVGVFNAEGEVWRTHRIPVASALNVRKINAFFPVLQQKTIELLERFKALANKDLSFNPQPFFSAFTIDVTTAIAFGYEMNRLKDQDDEFQRCLEIIFPMISKRVTAPFPLWRYWKRKADRELDQALSFIQRTVLMFIEDAKQRMWENPDLRLKPTNLLESLLADETAQTLSDSEIFGNVFTMLLAGEDTTSNTMTWTFYYLAQHPAIVSKIKAEATAVLGNSPAPQTHAQIGQLKYTQAVVQEVLRLKPVSPQLLLEANEEVIIQGLQIPEGTKIILQNKVAQTHEDYFSEPQAFKPERWLKGACPVHQPDVVKTFGGGPRFCPGRYLATHEMVLVLASLCKAFQFELAIPAEAVKEKLAFTMYPAGLKIRVIEDA